MCVKKNTSAFSVVPRACQYMICYTAVRTCVYTVRRMWTWLILRVTLQSKTKDRMWKSKSGLLCLGSAAPPPYSPDMSSCHEIKRTVQRPPYSNFKWPKFGHDSTYARAELQWPTWWCEKASRSLEMCHRSQGGTLNDVMWKLTWMNKSDWFLAMCALLLKWTSYPKFI